MTPPVVSIPRVRGQTSMRTMSSLPSLLDRIPPWTAGTIRYGFIRVDTLRRLLATKVLLEELFDLRDTGGTTDKDDL